MIQSSTLVSLTALQQLLVSIGSSAVTAAVIAAWFRHNENAQLYKQNRDIEDLKSAQRLMEAREKARFEWLHEKRAEVVVDIYALIVNVDIPINRLVSAMTHVALTPDAKGALFSDAVTAGNLFRKRYAEIAVLMPERIVDKLQAFDDLIWRKYIMASVYGKDQTISDRIKLAEEADWSTVREEIRSIRILLRQTLGDVEAERGTDGGKGAPNLQHEERPE